MSMLTRRRFCGIALAAPAIAEKVIREPNVTSDDLRKIEQVENSLMELRDGKAVRVNVGLPERVQQQHVPATACPGTQHRGNRQLRNCVDEKLRSA